jgi:hypothetical protein
VTGPDLVLSLLLACGTAAGAAGTTAAGAEGAERAAVETPVPAAAPVSTEPAPPQAQQPAPQTSPPGPTPPALVPSDDSASGREVRFSLTLGIGFSHNYTDGEFVRFSAWKPGKQGVTLDAGEQHIDDVSSVGVGINYWRNLDPDTTVAVGVSGGSGPYAPRFGVGGQISRPLLTMICSAGASYREWQDGNYTTEIGGGVVRWFPHVILGAGAVYTFGEPASFEGWRGNAGLTYYVWRRTYASVSVDFGEINQRDFRFDTRQRGVNVGFSQWFGKNWGVNVVAGRNFEEPVIYGVSTSWFGEW